MKNKLQILTLFIGLLSLYSCNDFLDSDPKDRATDKQIWEKEENAKLYVNYFYNYLHTYGIFGSEEFQGTQTEGLTETFKYGSYLPGNLDGNANLYVLTHSV